MWTLKILQSSTTTSWNLSSNSSQGRVCTNIWKISKLITTNRMAVSNASNDSILLNDCELWITYAMQERSGELCPHARFLLQPWRQLEIKDVQYKDPWADQTLPRARCSGNENCVGFVMFAAKRIIKSRRWSYTEQREQKTRHHTQQLIEEERGLEKEQDRS